MAKLVPVGYPAVRFTSQLGSAASVLGLGLTLGIPIQLPQRQPTPPGPLQTPDDPYGSGDPFSRGDR